MTNSTDAASLGEQIKRLAEDMADAACATEAGDFVARQRTLLHAAIDCLVALASPPPAPLPAQEEPIKSSFDWIKTSHDPYLSAGRVNNV